MRYSIRLDENASKNPSNSPNFLAHRGFPRAPARLGPAIAPWVSALQVAAAADFLGNILPDVSRPAFGGIEADDPHRVFALYVQQVGDNVL
jgi:hypothetical protein